MSDDFDWDFEELVRDVQGQPRYYAVQIKTLRKRLDAVKKLPEIWRRPHNITRNRPDAKDFCADELETALKENDDE